MNQIQAPYNRINQHDIFNEKMSSQPQTRRKKKTRSILLNPVSYFSIRSDKFRHFPYRAFLSCFVSDIFDDTESGIRLAELR